MIRDIHRQRHPLLAAVLAIIFPGLGHVYIRAWARAILWASLFVSAVVFLVPEPARSATLSFGGITEIYAESPEIAMFLVGLSVMNVLDAYLTALRLEMDPDGEKSETTTCPNCGKDLDDALEFCHWCTTELDSSEE